MVAEITWNWWDRNSACYFGTITMLLGQCPLDRRNKRVIFRHITSSLVKGCIKWGRKEHCTRSLWIMEEARLCCRTALLLLMEQGVFNLCRLQWILKASKAFCPNVWDVPKVLGTLTGWSARLKTHTKWLWSNSWHNSEVTVGESWSKSYTTWMGEAACLEKACFKLETCHREYTSFNLFIAVTKRCAKKKKN